MKESKLTRKVMNLSALIAMIAINIVAQTLPLGGHTTAEVSAMYPTLLTPAPVTFSIWSVIYMLLAWAIIGQLVSSKGEATDKMGWFFVISCACNVLWIVFWHYELLLPATIVIAALWVCLMMLANAMEEESWLMKAAFRIYYGWITVATAAQIYILLSANIPAIHTKVAAVIITIGAMVVLTIFGLLRILGEGDFFFGLAVAWALAGVFINHVTPGYNGMYPSIVFAGGTCTVLLLAAMVYLIVQARKRKILPEAQ